MLRLFTNRNPYLYAIHYNSMANSLQFVTLGIGIIISIIFSLYTVRKKALTLDGALTASFLGLWVLWFAGALWLIPLFLFFITGTLLGRLSKRNAQATDAKHGKARDYLQVLCNGGIYAALATFTNSAQHEFFLTLMLVSMSICTADTWSSEIGIYYRWNTYDIVRFRPAPVGLSGGVSLPGTLGGLLGALAMAIVGSLLLYHYIKFEFLLQLTIAGFAGMLLDSVMGASLQARYKNMTTNSLTDNPSENAFLQNGWRWMTNDAVNFWSNLLIIGAFALYYM